MNRLSVKLVFAVLLLCSGLTFSAGRSVVLVAGRACSMHDISMLDVRKAYLGVDISIDGRPLHAFRHDVDTQLEAVFFQNVVAMSERTYERRLLRLVLKSGRPRPLQITSAEDLADALNGVPCGISYMWQSDADRLNTVRVLKVLWQEN